MSTTTTTVSTSRMSPSPALSRSPWLAAAQPPSSVPSFPLSIEDEALLLNPLNLGTDEEEEVWDGGAVGLGFGFAHAQWSSLTGKSTQKPHKTCPLDELDFTCHICFETASDPCVTRCGHVYCLRDLRSWLKSSLKNSRPESCPACKAPCVFERDVVMIFDRAGKRPVYQPNLPSSPGGAGTRADYHSSPSSCPTPNWRPSTYYPPTLPSTPGSGVVGVVPARHVSSPTPPPTSTEVTPRPSVSSAAQRPLVPKEEEEEEPVPLPTALPPRRKQRRTPKVYAHPLDAQQAYFEPCSRVFSLIALGIVVAVLLK